tara:strand:+ start:1216 stop:1539 length:324 start_codon:yes stop_codon:yes gene_type:complete
MDEKALHWFYRIKTGAVLSVLAGLAFFLLCMILPLVGPAGSRVSHAADNKYIFMGWLFITSFISIAAVFSRWWRVKHQQAPKPLFSVLLSIICLLTWIVLFSGGFAI